MDNSSFKRSLFGGLNSKEVMSALSDASNAYKSKQEQFKRVEDEYARLNDENSTLKSKISALEAENTELIYNVSKLEELVDALCKSNMEVIRAAAPKLYRSESLPVTEPVAEDEVSGVKAKEISEPDRGFISDTGFSGAETKDVPSQPLKDNEIKRIEELLKAIKPEILSGDAQ